MAADLGTHLAKMHILEREGSIPGHISHPSASSIPAGRVIVTMLLAALIRE